MCGIFGYYAFSDKKPDKDKVADMFSLLQSRGTDASGFAFIKDDGDLFVHKSAIRSSEMITSPEWKSLELPRIMVLHTRMKTQGSEKNNANNHPLFTKNGVAIVHNGIIYNDREIFASKKRDGEVDSEAILALLSQKFRGDRVKKLFDRIEGSFAVAVIDKSKPDLLTLIKKDNPIELLYDSRDDILYFCSERSIMQEVLNIKSVSKRGFNLGESPYHFYTMENNHLLIVNSTGVDTYKKYSPRRDSWSSPRYNCLSLHDVTIIECPWCLTQTKYNTALLNNHCETCGMTISEEDIYGFI